MKNKYNLGDIVEELILQERFFVVTRLPHNEKDNYRILNLELIKGVGGKFNDLGIQLFYISHNNINPSKISLENELRYKKVDSIDLTNFKEEDINNIDKLIKKYHNKLELYFRVKL